MKTLLLCGYRNLDLNENSLIDRRIQQLWNLEALVGTDLICVLSGAHADDQLRQSRHLSKVEIAFDTNHQDVHLLTNIRAGLAACTDREPCFVLPIEIPCPENQVWQTLKEGLRASGIHSEYHLIQIADKGASATSFGFPLIITAKGNQLIRKQKNISSLVDPQLKYLRLSPEGALASIEKAL